MVWQKAYPGAREPFFLYNLCSYLYYTMTPNLEEGNSKIAKVLSYNFLSKAAKDVPSVAPGKESASPPRALQNEQDLRLLVRMYRSQEKYEDALSVLEDPRTGFVSRVANKSWETALEMIELNGLCERWEAQWHMCHDLLTGSLPGALGKEMPASQYMYGDLGDDWKIWDALVTACGKMIADRKLKGGLE